MRINKQKQTELIKQLIADIELHNFTQWLKICSPVVNTQTEFEIIRKLYIAVLTHIYNNDGDAFAKDALHEGSLFMVSQMYEDNKHVQYHMSIINNMIQRKLVSENIYKDFNISNKNDYNNNICDPKILTYSIKETQYEHHYKGLDSFFDLKSEILQKEMLMNYDIKTIKSMDLERLTEEKLTLYKDWSKKADEYLAYIYKLNSKIVDSI